MDQSWEVRAVWTDRGGSRTERWYHFRTYADARREVVRLFCHLGFVEPDQRALTGLEIRGDFWEDPGVSP
jgi:hypothetical protein